MKRLAAAVLLAGCASHRALETLPEIPITLQALQADSIAAGMMQRAFDADVRLITPDSLYLADAEIIANGLPRADAPRFAGVQGGGTIQLGSSRFAVTGNLVWGSVQYRWIPPTPAQPMADGWATIVIARRRTGEWRIVHVHSSTAHTVEVDTVH